jgi:hypothetical protein
LCRGQSGKHTDILAAKTMLRESRHVDIVSVGVEQICERLELPRGIGEAMKENDRARGWRTTGQQDASRAGGGNAVVDSLTTSDRGDRTGVCRLVLLRWQALDHRYHGEPKSCGWSSPHLVALPPRFTPRARWVVVRVGRLLRRSDLLRNVAQIDADPRPR